MSNNPPPGESWSFLTDAAAFAKLLGPVYMREVEPDRVSGSNTEGLRFGFRVQEKHVNAGGNCHGGMLAMLLDIALARSGMFVGGHVGPTPTISLQMDFLQPAIIGDWIESRCRHLLSTRRTGFCDALLVGPRGLVLRGSGVFRIPKQTARDIPVA